MLPLASVATGSRALRWKRWRTVGSHWSCTVNIEVSGVNFEVSGVQQISKDRQACSFSGFAVTSWSCEGLVTHWWHLVTTECVASEQRWDVAVTNLKDERFGLGISNHCAREAKHHWMLEFSLNKKELLHWMLAFYCFLTSLENNTQNLFLAPCCVEDTFMVSFSCAIVPTAVANKRSTGIGEHQFSQQGLSD